ncbi:DNA alkylation repair protein [Paenibacillus sp. CN-4]|uniref:DNA alkylation repair protein n=1 Tax=Paenibacillus nanchangensis TaxID=3348343 RepID=UPI003979F0F6
MAEALKNMYSSAFLNEFGQKVQRVYQNFDTERFVALVTDEPWRELELKARIRAISTALGNCLQQDYGQALDVLYKLRPECTGFPYLFFPDFVEVFGQAEDDWERSMQALEVFTSGSSSEFAVRPFLLKSPERMMRQMEQWALSPDEHVRRLASEGCRPRLPWGQSLPEFKRNPARVLRVLELLKADPSPYVRKSVANNLNDIAKDHPGLVAEIAARWIGLDPGTDWIVRHGCRTLIRKADPAVLSLFGYADLADGENAVRGAWLQAEPQAVPIGGSCELRYRIRLGGKERMHLRIEYAIDFVKSGGKTSRKLFLLSDRDFQPDSEISGTRMHRWADLTTRRHYPGLHRIVLLINGREAAETAFTLVPQGEGERLL